MATINEILDRFERDYVPHLAPRTRTDYGRHILVLRSAFGAREADSLTPRELGGFLNVPKGKIQRNRQMAVLSCAMGEAVGRWYMADRNPCRDVKRNPTRHRNRYVSDAEFEGCKALASIRVRCAMELALLTGQRQGDVIALLWSQVTDRIYVQQGKTGKRLAIKITPAVEAALDKCWLLKGSGCTGGAHVLPTRTGKPYTSEGFRACWQRTMRKWVQLGNKRFTFHDIRAKSASDSASINDAYQRLGHQDISITRQIYDRGIREVDPLK